MQKCIRWTGYEKRGLALIWSSFAEQWERMECAGIGRRCEYTAARVGKRGPRPMADVAADKQNNIPLVHDDPARRGSPGNRCNLEPVYILILALIRKYENVNERKLGNLFEIDQSTVSRYLVLADRILKSILPTPEKIMDVIRDIDTPQVLVNLFPDGTGKPVVIFDGTHVRFARPIKSEKRDPMISSKKKYPSGNTVIMTSADGLILGASKTYNGRVHDMTITWDFLDEMGRFGRMLQGQLDEMAPEVQQQEVAVARNETMIIKEEMVTVPHTINAHTLTVTPTASTKDIPAAPTDQMNATDASKNFIHDKTPQESAMQKETEIMIVRGLAALDSSKKAEQKLAALDASRRLEAVYDLQTLLGVAPDKIKVMGDSGFQGLEHDMPPAQVHTPFKNSKILRITPEQKEYNRALSKRRVKVENAICAAKHFRRVSEIYNGSLDEFNREFNIACGMANLRYMLRNGTYDHWAKILDLRTLDRDR